MSERESDREFSMKIGRSKRVFFVLLYLAAVTNASAGSITGEVKFSGVPPKLPAVVVSKDQDYCGERLPNDTYVVSDAGALKDVVVFIEAAPFTTAESQKINTIENDGCRYSPRILAMQMGEKFRITNKDPKLHIPHGYQRNKTVFMMSLPFRNTSLEATQKIREPGVIKVVCDTHAWMLAYVHVFDHPYFAVTDESGKFTLPNIPPGIYTLKAWHEGAGVRSQELTVTEGGDVSVAFEFATDKPY
jgi:Polysaccharide lyase family 4, domain II